MFKELVPILRQRAVLLTVTLLEEEQIRVNIVPKKIKDGDNGALTTPLSVTGTAEELDSELSSTIVSFVASHLQLKNTLQKAKAEMEEAAKQAKADVRSKAQSKSEPTKAEAKKALGDSPRPAEPKKPEPPRVANLFDTPTPPDPTPPAPTPHATHGSNPDDDDTEEDEILSEIADDDHDEEVLDEAA
jgi:PRTRC genetic system protein E